MSSIADIFQSSGGAKALVEALATHLSSSKAALKQWLDFYAAAKPPGKGRCLEGLELATRTKPELAESCFEILREAIADRQPTLKREASRVIANIAATFPAETAELIPLLRKNSEHESTVVRWATAMALAEIAKANPAARKKLLPLLEANAESEENNGVKNIYVKGLKVIVKLEKQ